MLKSGLVAVRGAVCVSPWGSVELDGYRFCHTEDVRRIVVEPIAPAADERAFVDAVRDRLRPLSYYVAYHGLVAQEYAITHISRSNGDEMRVGTFDIRLADQLDWRGLPSSFALDLADARDFWIERILAKDSRRTTAELVVDVTLMRATECLLRALVSPRDVLINTYLALEHVQRRLGGRQKFSKLGLNKPFIDYVMERANNRPEPRSRHAHSPLTAESSLGTEETDECLKRTQVVIKAYAQCVQESKESTESTGSP